MYSQGANQKQSAATIPTAAPAPAGVTVYCSARGPNRGTAWAWSRPAGRWWWGRRRSEGI